MSLMSAKKLLMQGSRKLRPQNVFATRIYTGNGASQTITNGLDMLGKGGLVWVKRRDAAVSNVLLDTQRQNGNNDPYLLTNDTQGEVAGIDYVTFLNSGITFNDGTSFSNVSNGSYVTWCSRRAKGFFDIVTYTGDGVSGRQIPHNLGVTPGLMISKARNNPSDFAVYHRSRGRTKALYFNRTNAEETNNLWTAEPNAANFTVGNSGAVNVAGGTYVAYLYAQNSDLIDCGSYVGNGNASSGPVVTCGSGWTPQFLIIKAVSVAGAWNVYDDKRATFANAPDRYLRPNVADAEASGQSLSFTATGFKPTTNDAQANQSGTTYVYLAIRSPT